MRSDAKTVIRDSFSFALENGFFLSSSSSSVKREVREGVGGEGERKRTKLDLDSSSFYSFTTSRSI